MGVQVAVWVVLGAVGCLGGAPHILFVVSDDLGYNDVSLHGSEVQTPYIDSLASNGVHFTHYYGHAICTPSRAALLSGRYASHVGLQHSYIMTGTDIALPLGISTVADELKGLGYRTHAVGKWHLGMETKAHTPPARGFDTFFGYLGGGEDYYSHKTEDLVDLQEGGELALNYSGKYSTELFADKAIEVIDAHPDGTPLFLYLAFQSVHSPLEAPQSYIDKYSWITSQGRRTLAAMTTCMDDNLKRVVDRFAHRGMADALLTIFVADNGGPPYVANSNWPMRGGKWTMWEGGTHLTALAHGKMLSRKNFTGLAHHVDWYPTLVEAAGGTPPPNLDGMSMWKDLTSPLPTYPRTNVVLNVDQTCVSNASNDPQGWSGYAGIVVKSPQLGHWKLVLGNPGKPDSWCLPNQNDTVLPFHVGPAVSESPMPDPSSLTCAFRGAVPRNTTGTLLFHLASDPRETTDLASSRPDVVSTLRPMLDKYIKSAVPPLNEFPSERAVDPEAVKKAKASGGWVPWRG